MIAVYHFVYYYTYLLIKKRNKDAKFAASQLVFVVFSLHLLLFISIVKSIYGINFSYGINSSNKYYFYPLGIALLLWFQNYYQKKYTDFVIKKYEDIIKVDLTNTIKYILIVVLPLIIQVIIARAF